MSVGTILQKHGKEMYIQALKHAINMYEINDMGGYSIADTAELLRKRIAEEEKEIAEIDAGAKDGAE